MKSKEDILARKRKYSEAYRLTHMEYFMEKNADYTINNIKRDNVFIMDIK